MQSEKERLVSEVQEQLGIGADTVEKLILDENVSDFYLENIKIRLGIMPEKKTRKDRKTSNTSSGA